MSKDESILAELTARSQRIAELETRVRNLETAMALVLKHCNDNLSAEDELPYPLSDRHFGCTQAYMAVRTIIEASSVLPIRAMRDK